MGRSSIGRPGTGTPHPARWSTAALVVVATVASTLAVTVALPTAAGAATITVATTADVVANDGQCSLREAIVNANTDSQSGSTDCPAGSGADTITLAAGTYTLTVPGADEDLAATGDLDIRDSLTVTGAGAGQTVIQAGTDTASGIDRVFHLAVNSGLAFTLSGVTVRHGRTVDNASFGAAAGGGIFANFSPTVSLTDVAITGNHSGNSGGGYFQSAGTLTILRSEISGNSSFFDGGGIQTGAVTAALVNSTVSGNTKGAAGVNGGAGILVAASGASWTIRNATIAGNTTLGATPASGLRTFNSINVDMANTILTANGGTECSFGTGTVVTTTNLADDGSCNAAPSPVTGFDLTLRNNGGQTRTHALLTGSNAIDAGGASCPDAAGSPLATDQRGYARTTGPCDVGAFEGRSLTVNDTGNGVDTNPGNGVCETAPGNGTCTLRAAILEANALPGADLVTFGLPGPGVQTIPVPGGLPAVTEALTIDGYTQPGAQPNTLATGSDAILLVELAGASGIGTYALTVDAPDVTIRGLVLNSSYGGIQLNSGAARAAIQGNFLGTTADGTAAAPSPLQVGVASIEATGTVLIGGTTPPSRNVLAGTVCGGCLGLNLSGGATVQGNYIGTNAAGTAGFGFQWGIYAASYTDATIGGTAAGAGNLIAGNSFGIVAVAASPASRLRVLGNLIGTNASGLAPLANDQAISVTDDGVVEIGDRVAEIGDGTAAGRNVIAVGSLGGIRANGRVWVRGNYLGVNFSGPSQVDLGIGGGYAIDLKVGGSTVGGNAPGDGNVIARTNGAVAVTGGVGNRIVGNSIYDNFGPAISLFGGAGNDPGDPDAGPNNLQNAPVISWARVGTTVQVRYGVDSDPTNSAYPIQVDFYRADNEASGEGKTFIGRTSLPARGLATFDLGAATGVGLGEPIVATATDAAGNTSPFSAVAVTVQAPPAATVTTYGGAGILGPTGITSGPDGALWFASRDNGTVGRMTTAGTFTVFSDAAMSNPVGITTGPDDALWFTSSGISSIGRIARDGTVTSFPLPTSSPNDIVTGPDGALWFTDAEGYIGRITVTGDVTRYSTGSDLPVSITVGPDGRLWFALYFSSSGSAIGAITTTGDMTRYELGSLTGPASITTGADGALWFTNNEEPGSIGRITTSGSISTYNDASIDHPNGITAGPDGALWFTNFLGNSIGRIDPFTGVVTDYTDPAISLPNKITTGADGALWFTNFGTDSIGRIAVGPTSTTYVVTTTADSGPGSLRQAILDANAHPNSSESNPDLISFDIPGPGLPEFLGGPSVHTITPMGALPAVTDSVQLDATSQPGATCAAWPPTLKVVVNSASGLTVASGSLTLRGLVLRGYTFNGLTLNSNGNVVECNYFGTDAAGQQPESGADAALNATGRGNVIGGPSATQANAFFGAANHVVRLGGGANGGQNQVLGNWIHQSPTGVVVASCCVQEGVLIQSSGNEIGGVGPGEGNRIGASAGTDGVAVWSGTGNRIRGNAIKRVAAPIGIEIIGIDLDDFVGSDSNGPTPNDPLDADLGANNRQNSPVLTSASPVSSGTRVQGRLDSTPSRSFEIDVYSNASCAGPTGEGAAYLGTVGVTTDAAGSGAFDDVVAGTATSGWFVTATANDMTTLDTSEFSGCATVSPTEVTNLVFGVKDDSGTEGVTQVGVGAVPITDIPIESIVGANGASYESAPLGSIPLGSIPLGSIDLEASPLGSIPLGSIPLGSIDVKGSPLGSIPLGSIPLGSIAGGWASVLDGTPLAGSPLQNVTLNEVLALDPRPSALADVTLADVGLADSPLGSIGLPAVALGDEKLLTIDPTLCDGLAAGFDCADPATDTLLELQLASAPLGSIPLGSIPLGSIPLGSIPLGSIPLGSIPLGSIPLGSIPLGSIPLESAPLGSIPLGSINLQGAPLGSIPLGSIPLGSIAGGRCANLAPPTGCADLGLTDASTIAQYVDALPGDATLASSPLGSIPLGSIPLGSIPLGSIPLGSIPLGSIDLLGAPLGSIPLGSIPLGSITLSTVDAKAAPLGSIPLGSIPLGSIGANGGCALIGGGSYGCAALGLTNTSTLAQFKAALAGPLTFAASPLGSIPLGSIDLGTVPLGSIPLGSIPLGSIGATAADLQDSPLGSIPLGSIGGCAALDGSPFDCDTIGVANTTTLVDLARAIEPGRTLADTPLGSIPLGSIPLGSIDLLGAPLGSIPLGSIPLGSIPLGSIDLYGAPLGSIPLGSIPLGSIGPNGGCEALAAGLYECMGLGVTDTSTLADFIAALPSGTTISDTPLGSIPLGSIPLGSIPLGSIPLGSIPLGSIGVGSAELQRSPLGSIPLGSIGGCAALATSPYRCGPLTLSDASTLFDLAAALERAATPGTLADTPLGSIPLGSIPLGSIPLGSIDLDTVRFRGAPLGSIPLGSIGLDGQGLAATPLGSIPLGSIDVGASPLGSIPLGSIPLGSIAAVVDCSKVTCSTATLADAQTAPAIRPGAVLGQLGSYGSTTLTDLRDAYGSTVFAGTTLGQLTDQLTLQQLYGERTLADPRNDFGDLTFGQLLVSMLLQSDFPWETLPLKDMNLQAVAPTGTVTYTASFDFAGGGAPAGLSLEAAMPAGFWFQPGSAALTESGTSSPLPDPTITTGPGGRVELAFPLTVPSGRSYEVTWRAVPGLDLGTTTTSARVVLLPGQPSNTDTATITVTEVFTGNNDVAGATPIAADTLVFSHTSAARTSDYFEFAPGPAGTRNVVFVSQFDTDTDLVLYKPATKEISAIPTRNVPLGSVPLDDDGVDFGGATTQEPELQGDVDLQPSTVAGVSINRGTAPETAESTTSAAALSPGDPYVIQVSPYQGRASDNPYVVRLKRERVIAPPACAATSFTHGTPTGIDLAGLPAGLNTLFLFNEERFTQQYGATAAAEVRAAIEDLISGRAGGVVGAILAVEDDPAVQGAYAAWDAAPCNPDLANDVVTAITALIGQVQASHPRLAYVTVVGNDDMVPFARLDDLTAISNESTFTEQFSGGALLGSLQTRHYLSDDPYGDLDPIKWLDRRLHLPELAVGRLVERPDDITLALGNFVDFGGRLDPDTAAVAGYDFLADGTTVVLDRLTNIYGAAFVRNLIDVSGKNRFDTWTRQNLLDFLDLSDATPASTIADIVSVNAHSDQYRQLPSFGDANKDENDVFSVDDLSGVAPNALAGKLVFTMGCHAGLSVSDIGVTTANAGDWAQTYSALGATYVGNTGYGYGDTVSVALTERLMAEFAENLDGGMSAGQAMAFAKQEYFAQLGQYGPYDEKSMQQVVFYGLPMYDIVGNPPAVPPAPLPTALYPRVDLPTATIGFSPTYTRVTTPGVGTYLSIDGQTQNTQYRPIQPLDTFDVSQDTLLAHGAIVTEASTIDEAGVDPVYFRPNVTGSADQEPEVPADEIATELFDVTISTFNAPGTGPAGEPFVRRQRAAIVAGSFRSARDGSQVGIQTRVKDANIRVLYTAPSSTDFTAPPIRSVDSALADGQVSFTVTTSATDVAAILVLYRREVVAGVSRWVTAELVADPLTPGSFTGGGPVDPSAVVNDAVDYKVWAVDTAGNVSTSDQKNVLWQAAPLPPADTVGDLDVIVPPATAGGVWNTGPVTVQVVGTPGVTYTVDGATPARVTGSGRIVVSGEGYREVTVTGGGATSTFVVLIDTTDPTIEVRTPTEPASLPVGAPAAVELACVDAGSGIAAAGCTATLDGRPVEDGAPIDTSVPRVLRLVVDATDKVGNTTRASTTIRVGNDRTPPVVTGSVQGDPPNAGWFNRPVAVRWSVDDPSVTAPADTLVTDEGASRLVGSGIVCDLSANCATGQVTLSIDLVAPDAAATTSVEPDVNGWNKEPVTVSVTCSDALSGVATCPAPVTLSADGRDVGQAFSVVDRAGNVTSVAPRTINIDRTPPVLTFTAPANGSTVSQASYVRPTCSASDALSGLDGVCSVSVGDPLTVTGGYTVTAVATVSDIAGNSRTATSTYTVRTDLAGPVINPTATPDPNAAGWWKTTVVYTFACSDPSGVAVCPTSRTLAGQGAGQTFTVSASDVLGNASQLTMSGINIDLTPPSVAVSAPSTVGPLDTVTITCTASDALSGVASATCENQSFPAATLAPGPNVFTFSATDVAGNTTTVTRTVTLVVPVNPAPVVRADLGVTGLEEIGFQSNVVILTGSFADPGGPGPFSASVRWSAGGPFTPLILNNGSEFVAATIYGSAGTRTVTVRICDAGGACGTDDLVVRTSVTQRITPVRECVVNRGASVTPRYLARWGYDNPAPFAIAVASIPLLENTFTSSPFLRGQPQIFLPGQRRGVFVNTFGSGTQTWRVNGTTASASPTSTACS